MATREMTYLDIETAPAFPGFESADMRTQDLFYEKFMRELSPTVDFLTDGKPSPHALTRLYQEKAGLFAEFNKIVCVSFGWVVDENPTFTSVPPPDAPKVEHKPLRTELQSFYQLEEKALLMAVAKFMEGKYQFCAHFGKGFDYRVLAQKFIIHGLPLPACLDNAGKKPWEIGLVDTAEMWKFGDMKHTCSLDLLAHCFGLPSPKQDMHGADVGRVYHTEGIEGLKKIVAYCEADVRALVNVHRRMTGEPMIL
jgi:3'-5' exonuclease